MGKHLLPTHERARLVKARLVALFGGRCMDCWGEFVPSVFHFHHRNPKSKAFNVGEGVYRYAFKRVVAECKKCVLLCANCHIRRHNPV